MKTISFSLVRDTVARLFREACYAPGNEVDEALARAGREESCERCRLALSALRENLSAARELNVPVCQDTGMAVVFCEMGDRVRIEGGCLSDAVNAGVAQGYTEGRMRLSVVSDPLYDRKNTETNAPAILHLSSVPGDGLRIVAAPKGFGSENKSALKMFTPAAGEEEIVSFVRETVRRAGADPCPPIMVGVGIGGDFEYCATLAKRALIRPIGDRNADPRYAALEDRLLSEINGLGIGAAGFGGSVTALAVKVETYPTHIAGLPVAVNINCHAIRHAEARL
ncbi:MAG: fumarate hydratase [Clostridia bacterium]|nr:fumarate hydratase [Clostridia bacterium]